MKFRLKHIEYLAPVISWIIAVIGCAQKSDVDLTYLKTLKEELQLSWPDDGTINLVFHGHSVPTGYMKTPMVNRLESYPFLTLKKISEYYSHAVINVITTSIGGEQSKQGAKRFKEEVFNYQPDVLFIDYALYDRSIGMEKSKKAWEQMIQQAIEYSTEIVLFTPTQNLNENILDMNSTLEAHCKQIRKPAKTYKIGLVDSFALFQTIAENKNLEVNMAQNNHINEYGHMLVTNEIEEYFVPSKIIK